MIMDRRTFLARMGAMAPVLAVGLSAGPRPARAEAWVPPIGIPHPGFGVDEVAPPLPSGWSTNVSGFYYVRQGGSNSGNGYPASPRGSLPSSPPPGSVVVMDRSTAFGSATSEGSLSWNGAAGAPIFVQSSTPGTPATWLVSELAVMGSYINFDWIDFYSPSDNSKGAVGVGGHHVMFRDCTFRGNPSGGGGTGLYGGHHAIWLRCTIRDNGDWRATFDQDSHGWSAGNCNNGWVCDCTFFHNSGDGVQINGGQFATTNTRFIYVGRNLAYENKQTGFWSKGATDVIFSQNHVHSHSPSDSSPGAGMGQQYGPDRVWYLFNHIHDCTAGIVVASDSASPVGTEGFVIGNLIHKITGSADDGNGFSDAGVHVRGGQTWSICNNTMYDVPAGVSCQVGRVLIENNIFTGIRSSGSAHIIVPNANAGSSTCRNNLFGPGAVSFRVTWNGSAYSTLASLLGAGVGSGCVVGDPLFVNPAAGDTHLRTGSPAINTGITPAAYARFEALYGRDIRRDFDNAARPSGAWDMGAFEFAGSGGGTPTPPAAPSGLIVR